jgi:hypothetical protein
MEKCRHGLTVMLRHFALASTAGQTSRALLAPTYAISGYATAAFSGTCLVQSH